jgi:hypothetical protein
MLFGVAVLALALIFLIPMLTAADAAPTPLTADEAAQAAEAAILLQQAQINLLRAQQELTESGQRYQQFIAALKTKHGATGCELNARQQWNCPKETGDAGTPDRTPGTGNTGPGRD